MRLHMHIASIIMFAASMGFLVIGLHYETMIVIGCAGILLGYALLIHANNLAILRQLADEQGYREHMARHRDYRIRINR